ncbi:hypothetical protein [Parafrankia sp. FMc2]|uniref:hypothetical protein n=1 Tax=Parafrankia sp. FMc2 TaxID=3233196 RepID=UPI0034D5D84A
MDNPQDGDPGTAAAVAGTAPPAPHPPLPTTDTSPAGPTPGSKETAGQAPAAASPVDLVQVLVDLVHEVTGRTIDRDLAGKGVAMVLRTKDGSTRTVSDPVAYLRTAVEAAPARFLPSMVPPPAGSSAMCKQHGLRQPCDHCAGSAYGRGRFDYPQRDTPEIDPGTGWPMHMSHNRRETKQERTGRIIAEFAASAAEATDGGQRVDNSGVTVVDEHGQPASNTPPEPLCGSWTDEPVPAGWMSASAPAAGGEAPAWCGQCGGDAGHAPAVMQANVAYRTDTGRPAGNPCPRCHPDVVQAAA